MQRIRISKENIALYCVLSLALTMGMAPVPAYAVGQSPQEVAPQSVMSSIDNNKTTETAPLTSFHSFGKGCEWALDASGALTVRAAGGESGTLPPERGLGPMQLTKSRRWCSSRALKRVPR